MSDENITVDNGADGLNFAERVGITVVFLTVVVVGVVGNTIVITLILMVKKMQTTVNLCLSALAFADLVVLVFLPILPFLWMFDHDDSSIGEPFCIFLASIDRGAVAGSVMIFLFVSVERYIALCHPLNLLKTWKGRKLAWVLLATLTVSVAVSIPYGYATKYEQFLEKNETKIYCYTAWEKSWLLWYDTLVQCACIFLPAPFLVVLYGRMVVTLRRQVSDTDQQGSGATSARKNRAQVVLMLLSVVTIFITCHLPFRIYVMLDTFAPEQLYLLDQKSLDAFNWVARILLYVNHTSNPIVYFLMSSNFRDAFKSLFCRFCRSPKNASNESYVRSHTQSWRF